MNTYYVDASLLKEGGCFRKLINKSILQLRSKETVTYKMAYCSAVHIFLDLYYRGRSHQDCARTAVDYYKNYLDEISSDPKEFRTLPHLVEIFKAYIARYPRGKDGLDVTINKEGEPLIENQFSVPYKANEFNQLIICGTMDLYCTYNGIANTFVDHKGSSGYYKEGCFDHYQFDIQMMLYSLFSQKLFGLAEPPSFVINGFFIKKSTIKAADEGIFDGVAFHRSPVFKYDQTTINAFELWLGRQCEKIWQTINNDPQKVADEDYNPALCAGKFGFPCEYFDLCAYPEKLRAAILKHKFETYLYEPLKFREQE